MKKTIMTLVAALMMTLAATAQDNQQQANHTMTFDQLINYLELTTDQVEPVKKEMARLQQSMDLFNKLPDSEKNMEKSDKMLNRHKQGMRLILTEKQFNKYEQTLNLTVRNRIDQASR